MAINKYVPNPGDLYKAWSVPRSSDQAQQLTVRMPADTFFKIQAIHEMFPGRSRNEIISDLLSTAVEEFEASLDSEWIDLGGEPVGFDEEGEPIFRQKEIGTRAKFHRLLERIIKDFKKESENPKSNVSNLDRETN